MKLKKGFFTLVILLLLGGFFLSSSLSFNALSNYTSNTIQSYFDYNKLNQVASFCVMNPYFDISSGSRKLIAEFSDSRGLITDIYFKIINEVYQIEVDGAFQINDLQFEREEITVFSDYYSYDYFYILNVYIEESGQGELLTKFQWLTCSSEVDVQFPPLRITIIKESSFYYAYSYNNSTINLMNYCAFSHELNNSKSILYSANSVLFGLYQGESLSVTPATLDDIFLSWQKKLVGFKSGLGFSFADGYSEGYRVGQDEAINQDIGLSPFWVVIRDIFNGVGDVLAIEIVPHITVGLIIFVPLTISLVGFILWIWRKH